MRFQDQNIRRNKIISQRVTLLKAIRDGEKYPKRNDLLAPLSASGLVNIENTGRPLYRIIGASLTEAGKSYLSFYLKEGYPK